MIGLNNKDSSFFLVESGDVPANYRVLSPDITSFQLTEEVGKMISGNINLNDPNHDYAKQLRMGIKINISWGYKDLDEHPKTALALKENPQEMLGALARYGVSAYIMSPNGGGMADGRGFYSCGFYGSEYSKLSVRRVYRGGTRDAVVRATFAAMGVAIVETNFRRGREVLTGDTAVTQWESNFKFLHRLSREWRCIFRIGYTPSGQLYGMFADHDKFELTAFQRATTGAIAGNSIHLDWKWGAANVISYKWKNHQGGSGTGDNVRMIMMNGKVTFVRYIAQGETVKAYRFVPEKVTKQLKVRGATGGLPSMTDYVKWALNVTDFNELVRKGYFVPYNETTAPQGLGYSANVEALGNPMMTAPMYVKFGRGFPDVLASRQNRMYCRKVTHKIDRSGYKMEIEVIDTLTATGGSFI